MTKPTLDKGRSFTEVGGMLPLKFMQNGHGFNRAGEYLGEFNGQGEKIADAPQELPDEPADLDTEQTEQETEQSDPEPPIDASAYKGVKFPTMIKEAEELGLDVDPSIDRDDLISLLVAAKAQ